MGNEARARTVQPYRVGGVNDYTETGSYKIVLIGQSIKEHGGRGPGRGPPHWSLLAHWSLREIASGEISFPARPFFVSHQSESRPSVVSRKSKSLISIDFSLSGRRGGATPPGRVPGEAQPQDLLAPPVRVNVDSGKGLTVRLERVERSIQFYS